MVLEIYTKISGSKRLFWVLNIMGWGGYVSASTIGAMTYEKPESYQLLIVLVAIIGFLLTILLRPLLRMLWNQQPMVLAAGTMGACYVIAVIWRVMTNLLYLQMIESDWKPTDFGELFSGSMSNFYVVLCWGGLYFGIKYYRRYQEQTAKTLRANAAAQHAQLKMLRYQLNPHFLFNTLNAISTLVLDNKTKAANLTVTRLGEFLRYTLDNDLKTLVTVRKELEALDLYLEIEKVRFGQRLQIDREIEAGALDALVPSLILQPLIENSVKYAVTPREEGGKIEIKVRVINDQLSLSLADDGPGCGGDLTNSEKGVGLKNTQQRLVEIYGSQQALTLSSNQPHGLIVTINIPYVQKGAP